MYKVFINEKKLLLTNLPYQAEKSIAYTREDQIKQAVETLNTTDVKEIALVSDDLQTLWEAFTQQFKIIEAAGGVVRNAEGKVLFIHRLGRWDLPKGKIEPGETHEWAALREVQEETQLSALTLGQKISPTYHIYVEKDGTRVLKITHWYQMEYSGNETPVPQIEEGITDVQWLGEADVYFKVLPTTFKNIELVLGEAQVLMMHKKSY